MKIIKAFLTITGVINTLSEQSRTTLAAKLDQFEEPEELYQEEQLVEISENQPTPQDEVGSTSYFKF